MNYLEKEFKYIYNRVQAQFFKDNGASFIETGVHWTSGDTFHKFKNNEKLQELYSMWNRR